MPSRPPETKVYDDPAVATLWRDISRLYENFLGNDTPFWERRQEQFEIVLEDILVRLRDSERLGRQLPIMNSGLR